MAQRRSLTEGFRPVDASLEKEFVYGEKAPQQPSPAAVPELREGKGQPASAIARVPFTTRVCADFAAALKRASLERQLQGVFPNTLQDILEEALEPWLRTHGHLP